MGNAGATAHGFERGFDAARDVTNVALFIRAKAPAVGPVKTRTCPPSIMRRA